MKLRVAVLTALTMVVLAGSTRLAGAGQTIAVRGETVHTLAGPAINDGIMLVRDGKITAVGPAASVKVPDGVRVLRARVVTPGLIDARSALGLAGFYNHAHDRDEVERSQPSQPELRAVDAFNSLDPLLEWVRGFGITTAHTGHAPEELIPGQTIIVKTQGAPVDRVLVKDLAAVAVSFTRRRAQARAGEVPRDEGEVGGAAAGGPGQGARVRRRPAEGARPAAGSARPRAEEGGPAPRDGPARAGHRHGAAPRARDR